jgi:hypothetical protein
MDLRRNPEASFATLEAVNAGLHCPKDKERQSTGLETPLRLCPAELQQQGELCSTNCAAIRFAILSTDEVLAKHKRQVNGLQYESLLAIVVSGPTYDRAVASVSFRRAL